MKPVLLIHWNEAAAEDRAQRLRKACFAPVVLASSSDAPTALKRLLAQPIEAIVIDLSRLPSHGRDIALHLRIVFVDGETEKAARVKSVLPDATFTGWPKIGAAIRTAINHRTDDPVVANVMAGYSGTPLTKKLGIKPGTAVSLINAPDGFERISSRESNVRSARAEGSGSLGRSRLPE